MNEARDLSPDGGGPRASCLSGERSGHSVGGRGPPSAPGQYRETDRNDGPDDVPDGDAGPRPSGRGGRGDDRPDQQDRDSYEQDCEYAKHNLHPNSLGGWSWPVGPWVAASMAAPAMRVARTGKDSHHGSGHPIADYVGRGRRRPSSAKDRGAERARRRDALVVSADVNDEAATITGDTRHPPVRTSPALSSR